jgi:MSHA type pilus biogenesis protein MshL
MTMRMRQLRPAGIVIPILALASCVSGAPQRAVPRSSVRIEPQSAPAATASVPDSLLPSAPTLAGSRQGGLSAAPERRIKLLEVAPGTPISQAVAQLASQLGMGVSIDPEVRGTTSGTLRNVTLDSALTELVGRRGYAFQVQGSVLRVVPIRMETRTFTLDYVALSRVGTMTTVVQRRLPNNVPTSGLTAATTLGQTPQAGFTNGAAYGGVNSGADVLTAQSVADIWQEIRIAIAGLLQAGQAQPPRVTEATGAAASNGSLSSGAASMSFADGATLVISPISGLISVTAMPDKLRAVDAFIADFQASVLRQVMIEAKIVEVSLFKNFEFGIDWTIVNDVRSRRDRGHRGGDGGGRDDAAGNSSFTLRSDPTTLTTGNAGNINFTLGGGATQVNAVIDALEQQGHVNVLSNEKTTALNNQRAIFNVTTDEVFFYVTRSPLLGPNGGVISFQNQVVPQQVSVGVVLDVLPQISADNVLTMDIRPAVTSISRVDSISLPDGTSASAPVIARREGDTIARLRAGETMVIGGLVQTRRENVDGGVPYLKDIPLLGVLFKRIKRVDSRSELVIFLTPTIVSGAPATGGGR